MSEAVLKQKKESSLRQKEIVKDYLKLLDAHIDELKHGRADRALEIS